MTRTRLSRALIALAVLMAVWAVVVLWTGGGVVHVGGIRLASRNARNSVVLAMLSTIAAWLLAPPRQRRQTIETECRRIATTALRLGRPLLLIPRPAQTIAAMAVVGVVIVGLTQGAFVAVASDSYGYVSQAHLWATGTLRQEPVLRRYLTPELPLNALSPLGYRATADGTTIGPTYSPGLPIVMAVFERLFGPASVFWVVPILGGVLVWATYVIGRRAGGPVVGSLAAVLLATSPPFLFQLTDAPFSDLPAAAWWALTMALIPLPRRLSALGAGTAAGLAILTRPNLVALIAIPVGVLIWRVVSERRLTWLTIQQTMLFAVGTTAAVLTIAAVNAELWGSPFISGYGSLSAVYGVEAIWPNLWLYPRVIATQVPVALLALTIPIAWWRRRGANNGSARDCPLTLALWGMTALVVLSYLPYPAFDSSQNLRFLLPALAPLLVLSSMAAVSLAGDLPQKHTVASAAILAIVTGYGVDYARDRSAFETRHLRRFADIGDYIARRLPERAVLLAMLHSGSATYYSGRLTLRYDLIPPSRLDWVVTELQKQGYVPYILLDDIERAIFRSRFQGQSRLAALNWPADLTMEPNVVQLFALPDAARAPEPTR